MNVEDILNVGGALRAPIPEMTLTKPLPDAPHSADLRNGRRYEVGGCWFVTKCLAPRRPVLEADLASVIAEALSWYAPAGKSLIGAFVVMPDHWHLLFRTVDGRDVSEFMRSLGHWISRKTRTRLAAASCQWQEGFRDTRVRSLKQFQFMRQYIEDNPVRKRLVAAPSDWLWSTANERYKALVPETWPVEFELE